MSMAFIMLQSMKGAGGVGYADKHIKTIMPETALAYESGEYGASVSGSLVAGASYTVQLNGTAYDVECVATSYGFNGMGNLGMQGMGEDNGLPFLAVDMDGEIIIACTQPGTVSITQREETIHTIDPKFIPAMDAIVLNGADGKQYTVTVNASGALSVTKVE